MLHVTHIITSVIVTGGGSIVNSARSKTKMKCTSSRKSKMDANMQSNNKVLGHFSLTRFFPDV